MDTPSLGRDDIDAGLALLTRFAARYPVRVAFWGYSDNQDRWLLFIAPEGSPDQATAYRRAWQIERTIWPARVLTSVIRIISPESDGAIAAAKWLDLPFEGHYIEAGPLILGNDFVSNALILRIPTETPATAPS
jgi:hypothetical protein